jgi:hypothetical protein
MCQKRLNLAEFNRKMDAFERKKAQEVRQKSGKCLLALIVFMWPKMIYLIREPAERLPSSPAAR